MREGTRLVTQESVDVLFSLICSWMSCFVWSVDVLLRSSFLDSTPTDGGHDHVGNDQL